MLGSAANAQFLNTPQGWVYGASGTGYSVFYGIPYTQPPAANGASRWKAPSATWPVWTGFRYANFAPPACAQLQPALGSLMGQEDCLFVNVFTKNPVPTTTKLPVIVYIHGGAMTAGSSTDPNIDGTQTPSKSNVVLVTLQYRLGNLGFLAHPALFAANESGVSAGNYGLMDVIQALRWIKANIAAYGGDPGKVTISGGSSGALLVWDILASSSANGLYQRAITESFAPSNTPSILGGTITVADGQAKGIDFANKAACTGSNSVVIACLRAKAVGDLMTAQGTAAITSQWGPVYGGGNASVLPRSPWQALQTGNYNHVGMINGTNHDEGRFISNVQYDFPGATPLTDATYLALMEKNYPGRGAQVVAQYPSSNYIGTSGTANPDMAYAAVITDSVFACTARTVNKLIGNSISVYAYELNDPNAYTIFPHFNYSLGSYHGAETYYIMQQATAALGGTAEQITLSNQMMQYWGSFAATGIPASVGLPTWSKYSPSNDKYITFEPAASGASGSNARLLAGSAFDTFHKCAFWSTFGI